MDHSTTIDAGKDAGKDTGAAKALDDLRGYLARRAERDPCHVSSHELCCHDRDATPYPWERVADGTLARLLGAFERIRSACGDVPIVIGCAYRTPEHNAAVGGVPRSQHVAGRAMDLHVPAAMGLADFHARVRREAHDARSDIGGLGLYPWGVHIDVRPRHRRAAPATGGWRMYAYWTVHCGDTA